MKKRLRVFGVSFLMILVCAIFVSASSTHCDGNLCTLYEGDTLTYSDNEFTIGFMNYNSVTLVINGENVGFGEGSSVIRNGMNITITNIVFQEYVGGEHHVEFTIEDATPSICNGNVCTLYEGDSFVYSGNEFEIGFISEDGVKLKINGAYTGTLGNGGTELIKEGGIKIIMNSFYSPTYAGTIGYANFTIEEIGCEEDWSCTDWSSCVNEKQTRTCTDSNSCETTDDKPKESQACSIKSECNSDEDCTIEATGQPYCDGDKLCIPSKSRECKNPGTEESYCVYPSTLSCETDEECIQNEEKKSMCEDNSCTLYEGDSFIYSNSEYKIEFISSKDVKLNINGEITNSLNEGDSQLIQGIKIVIDEILVQDYADGKKYVKFRIEKECDSIGVRYKGKYCSPEYKWVEEIGDEEECENNFECQSNLCLDNKCVSSTLIQKIINWFKRVFGKE